MKKYSIIALTVFFSLLGVEQLGAQLTFKANPDNAFVRPNAKTFMNIDVIVNDVYNTASVNDCTPAGLELSVWDGTNYVSNQFVTAKGVVKISTDNKIQFMPKAGEFGLEKLRYQIYCPLSGAKSQADIYILINDKPSVISDADCYVDPVGIKFDVAELAQSDGLDVNNLSNVICGDIDGDGNVEMLVFNHNDPTVQSQGIPTQILVFRIDPVSKKLVKIPNYTITFTDLNYRIPYATFAIANVNGNKYASIFYVADGLTESKDAVLFKYSYDENLNKYVEEGRVTVASNSFYKLITPHIADLMGSGNAQICILDKVYNAKTLALLADGKLIPTTGTLSSFSFGRGGHDSAKGYVSSLVTADIDNDGIQEIIGGDCVYRANITNFSSLAGNSFSLVRRVNKSGRTEIYDGGTAIADMNLDGLPEVIVTSKKENSELVGSTDGYVYVYNPRTGALMHSNTMTIPLAGTSGGPSRPFVGDIDGDGFPEICLSSFMTLRAYDLDDNNGNVLNTLKLKWELPTTDGSAATTLSLFDFGQQGFSQLVYRDEQTLRIIDGRDKDENGVVITTAKRTLFEFKNVSSATTNEYPIVADVNRDGAAEIIVTGNIVQNTQTPPDYRGKLRVFAAKGTKKWAPARPVWNQIAYNPVYVNDDLTIPARPINPATVFYSPDGTKNRPFNNFLQQATSLNKEGTMIMLGPDLTFDPRVAKRLVYGSSDNLNVSVGIQNQGDATFIGPIKLQLYAYIQSSNSFVPVGPAHYEPNPSGLSQDAPNNTLTISYVISNISSALPSVYDNLFMTVNLAGDPNDMPRVYAGSTECHEGQNNVTSGFSLVSGERIICEDDTETVSLEGVGSYYVKWYTTSTGGTSFHNGASYSVKKNSDLVTHYFVECYRTPSSPSPITNIRDTVFVYRAPDSLVWTGGANTTDWHNYGNWHDPSGTLDIRSLIPRGCTNVQLIDGSAMYPNLDASSTSYATYVQPECNNIHFQHGGELVRPDKLGYARAFVDATFNSHRWYMFAPPLKDFYTGDIYQKSVIPEDDDIRSWTKFWGRKNPVTNYPWGSSYVSDWTGTFHHPDQTFIAGQGIGVWIGDNAVTNPSGVIPMDPFDFHFPKNEKQYLSYVEGTNTPSDEPPYLTPRNNNYRFIFDNLSASGVDFNLSIDAGNATAGQLIMVANPFMAHLDFNAFYTANSTLIQDYYIILDENAVQQHYNKNGASTLSKYIAPMQAFLVEAKAGFAQLKANGAMTFCVPGDRLRSAQEESESFFLKVSASQGEKAHQTFITFSENGSENFKHGQDIPGLLPTKNSVHTRSIMLYSQKKDGMKVALNSLSLNKLDTREIPLGLWMPKKESSEDVTLNVSNLNLLPSGYQTFLYDKQADQLYDLSQNSMATFKSVIANNENFVEGRFFLRFTNEISSVENKKEENQIEIEMTRGELKVISSDIIEQIEVHNLQGQLILKSEVHANSFEAMLSQVDLCIVSVSRKDGVFTKKVINGRY